MSLNAETSVSRKYDSKLKLAEAAAIRQGTGVGFISGLLFFFMFCMYGVGFWFGGNMIADSTDEAMADHPIPADFFTGAAWAEHRDVVAEACAGLAGKALDTCACAVMWDALDMPSTNCGCGFDAGTLSVESVCFTGGKTILVFFSILMGGFGLGTAGPGAKEMSKARIAAAKVRNSAQKESSERVLRKSP